MERRYTRARREISKIRQISDIIEIREISED